MKIWLVQAEQFDYDQYSSFVIRAETAKDALRLSHFDAGQEPITVTEIDRDGPEGEIQGSFHAG